MSYKQQQGVLTVMVRSRMFAFALIFLTLIAFGGVLASAQYPLAVWLALPLGALMFVIVMWVLTDVFNRVLRTVNGR